VTPTPRRLPIWSLHAVTATRILILLVLFGVIAWTVLTWGRRGKPQPTITMAVPLDVPPEQGPVVDQSDRFVASGTKEGRPAFDLAAHTVTGLQGERKLLQHVDLTVHEQQGGTVQVQSREGQFDPSERRAQLNGDVAIKTPDGLSLETARLFYDSDKETIYTGDAIKFSLGKIEGTGQGLNYEVNERRLKIPAKVSLRVIPEDGGPPMLITAGSLSAALQENSAVFTEPATLERGSDRMSGRYLRLEMDESHKRVTGIRSYGDVVVTTAPDAQGHVSELRADSLTAALGATGMVETAEASGGCQFKSGTYTSTSRTALFRRDEDRLELRGDPVVLTDRERIAAQEIDLHPERQSLEARGDVRTTSLGDRNAEVPGFGSGSAVSFQSDRLVAEQAARRATYTGSARAWQEGSSLQADEIVVDEATRQLRGAGNVLSRFTTRSASKTAPGRPVTSTISAHHLLLDDAQNTAHYEGEARLSRPDATLTSDSMDVILRDAGKRRELDRILAHGSVSARHEGTFATASEAEYRSDAQILILRDAQGLAEVVDAATKRSMRGRELTYDLNGDRVLTESGEGGRAWITLTPEGKEGPHVEPPTPH
jgi:LPS export ABC transporter protein LptC